MENNNALDVLVFFTVTGGTITHINSVSASGTTGAGLTDEDGNATVTVTRDTRGFVTVTATVYPSCAAEAESKSIDIPFGAVTIVFCIDMTGSMAERPVLDNIEETINDLVDAGVPLRLGGVAFRDLIEEQIVQNLTTDVDGYIAWVQGLTLDYGGDNPENQLQALVTAKNMAPGAYIALATDNRFHYAGDPWPPPVTNLTEAGVISQLQAADCKVYIDPTSDFASYYNNLAVNGSIEQSLSLGQYVFPLLFESITQ